LPLPAPHRDEELSCTDLVYIKEAFLVHVVEGNLLQLKKMKKAATNLVACIHEKIYKPKDSTRAKNLSLQKIYLRSLV
jgi:hypothetical protein